MGNTITLRLSGSRDSATLRRRMADPTTVLKSIGAVVVAQGRQAFEDQQFGGVMWKERYPRQREPFLNIAPVIRKAGMGRTPTADDFRRRPALGGVGSPLAQSLDYQVEGMAVEAGTNFPDAGIFQDGGKAPIEITDRTRATLAKWLGTSGTRAPKGGFTMTRRVQIDDPDPDAWYTEETPGGPNLFEVRRKKLKVKEKFTTRGEKSDYARKLAFVFDPDREQYEADAAARPFIGFTDGTMDKVVRELADFFGGEVTG